MQPKIRSTEEIPWPGVLVVETGRWKHTRQALAVPATVVGQAEGCDLRLDVAGVQPQHCLLVPGPDGLHVRDLNTETGTFVNDRRVRVALLQAGDRLKVGPFEFRFEPSAAIHNPFDRDALRIQVAAVAAQQTALDEEEARLFQRRHDLERQEEQLSAHLDAERRTLQERAADLAQQAETVAAAQQESAMRQAALQRERATHDEAARRLAEDQAQCNTQRELQQRELKAGWLKLDTARQRWKRRRRREALALRSRRRELSAGERQLGLSRAALAREIDTWRAEQETVARELHGLQQRVSHLRGKIAEHAPTEPQRLAPAPAETAPVEWPTRFAQLDQLADELTDQRARLVEHWERLARVEADWFDAHDRAAHDLETLVRGLDEREESVRQRELCVAERERALHVRHEELAPAWQAVQIWRARLQARERAAEQEREQRQEAIRQREEQIEEQLASLDALRQQWQRGRHDEQAEVQSVRAALETQRHTLALLQQEWAERIDGLTPAVTGVEMLRAVAKARTSLKAERAALAEERQALLQAAERHAAAAAGLFDRERFLEHKTALLEVCRARMDQDRRRLEAERRRAEGKLVALQAELDGMVRTLLDDEPDVLPFDRAA